MQDGAQIQGEGPLRVAILGGGSAGWMTAAALAKYFGPALSVTLIESEAIGIVGVGEATIPQIRLYNSGLGIEERDFLRAVGGTMKLGIEFIGWRRDGARYFHGFGEVGRKIGLLPFHQYWLRWAAEGGRTEMEDFSPCAMAAKAGRYGPKPGAAGARMPASAYHLDAAAYAAFLRRMAEARGATRIEGIVRDWEKAPETGHIRALTLEDGRRVEADLFVDCSGFRAVLIGQAMGEGFLDWSNWLPCDRAVALPSTGRGRLDPFTRSTARPAGWQWEIPLQKRTGNGHVFSSAFMEEEEAIRLLQENLPGEALAEPRVIRFTAGKRRAMWSGNVVALGLSSGFLEPLESTSIHLIQAGIAQLIALFPDRRMDPALAAAFNAQMDFEYAAVRDFLILHYHLNERVGEPLWDQCRETPPPDSLAEKLDLFRANGTIRRFNTELFDVPSWLQVMWGQGLRPAAWHPMAGAAPKQDLARYIAMNAAETRGMVDALDDHGDFIARVCGAPEPAGA